mgnify:FL=1
MANVAEDEMRAIVRKIARIDPAFNPIIKSSPLCTIGLKKYSRSHFETLINSILSQQLAIKAADTIIKRVNNLVDGKPKPQNIIELSDVKLREVGVYGAKARSMHDLAQTIIAGDIKFHKFPKLSNQEISAELTKIWGIGRWTSEMFLMFHLGRLDVWPVGDLGMRRGWEKLHRMRSEVDPKKLDLIGEKFDGFQSVVAWYCWRATEGDSVNW